MEEKILVSACLAGVCCRMDGKSKPVAEIVSLYEQGKCILVCPEVLGGLSTPRAASERLGDRVINTEGHDNTEAFRKGAQETLRIAKENHCTKAILKSKSPSCGSGKIYDGTFSKTLIDGDGVATQLLKQNGIEVTDEKHLKF